MIRKSLLAALAMAAPMLVSYDRADAYDLKPMIIQLRPTGAGSAATAVITNTHSVPIAIEIHIYRREQLPNGDDKLTPDDSDLLVTPPQMVIAPKASQSFRIQWVGDPRPERELAYRVVTTQLPIQFKHVERNDFTADINMRYEYEMALYIEPEGTEPSASLVSAETVTAEGGAREVELRIRSEGTRRAILDRPVLELAAPGAAPVRLEGEAVQALTGLNILPGVERVVRIPAPEDLPSGKLTAKLDTRYLTLR